MSSVRVGSAKSSLLKWLVAIILPLLIWLCPVTELFTANLKMFSVITVFIIAIIALELLPVLIAAVLLPTLYYLSGIVTMETAFATWTTTTVWMVLGALILSAVLDECRLLRRIAYVIITKFGGTYKGAVFGSFVIGIVLNIITFGNGWPICLPLVYGICKAMNLKKGKEACLICFAGCCSGCGSIVYLFHPGYSSLLQGVVNQFIPDWSMSLFTLFIYNSWYLVFCLIALVIFLKMYKVKDENLNFNKEYFSDQLKDMGKMSAAEKKALAVVILILVYMFTIPVTGFPSEISFLILPYLVFVPGMNLATKETIRKTNLQAVFITASYLGIGTVGAAVGFGNFITGAVTPVLEGQSQIVVLFLLLIVGIMANFVLTPLAMLSGLALPFAQVAVALGVSPIAAVMVLVISCDLVIFPYEVTGNYIMYSFGLMPMKDFAKQQAVKMAITLIGFLILIYPTWCLLGLI